MSTLQDDQAPLRLRAAVEARDSEQVVAAFAPDAVVRSPISGRLVFEGHNQIRALFRVILEAFEDIEYIDELRAADRAVLVARSRIGRTELELVDHMTLDADGRIRVLTVFFRPMPAIAVAARVLGAGLGRRTGPFRGRIISALAAPMALLTSGGDRLAVRLVRPALR